MRRICTALWLCWTFAAQAADDFDRLFTTASERAVLDERRRYRQLEPNAEPPAETSAVLPARIAVQGYIRRGDGKAGTVWVNQQPLRERSTNADIQVGKLAQANNRIPLVLRAKGKHLMLKPGQVYQADQDQITETAVQANPLLPLARHE